MNTICFYAVRKFNNNLFKVFLANKKGSYYTCKKLANSCLLFYAHKKNCFDKYII